MSSPDTIPATPAAAAPPRKGGTLSLLRSVLLLNNLIYLYTIVLGALSLLASLFDRSGRVQHWFAHVWSWLILKTAMVRVTVVGRDQLDTTKPYLYAATHASAVDIPVLYVHLPFPFRIIAKHELFRVPFMGWHLRRSGQIAIDRDNAHASFRSLRNAVAGLKAGMPLVVFPEGGRTATGALQPFLPGAFYVAIKAQVAVLPINTYHVHPGPVEMIFGAPIPTTGLTLHDMKALAERVQRAMEALIAADAHSNAPAAEAPAATLQP
jgi:1-acyl-sn-glycerol-3-phosphate acyltransferase